jgi:hypothetical protein
MIDQNKTLDQLTADELKEVQIEFAPGCFDDFEGTQEELDALIAEIKRSFADGSIHERSRELTEEEFEEMSQDTQQKLVQYFEDPDASTRKLQ